VYLTRLALIEHGSVSAVIRAWIKLEQGDAPEAMVELKKTEQRLKAQAEQEEQRKLQHELQNSFSLLESRNWKLRKHAVIALSPFCNRSDVRERLMKTAMLDDSVVVRMEAAVVLLQKGEKDSALVELIPSMLTDGDLNVRYLFAFVQLLCVETNQGHRRYN
jgi:hypothetical protein